MWEAFKSILLPSKELWLQLSNKRNTTWKDSGHLESWASWTFPSQLSCTSDPSWYYMKLRPPDPIKFTQIAKFKLNRCLFYKPLNFQMTCYTAIGKCDTLSMETWTGILQEDNGGKSSFLGRVNIMSKGTEESKCTACLRKGKCYCVVKGRQAVHGRE